MKGRDSFKNFPVGISRIPQTTYILIPTGGVSKGKWKDVDYGENYKIKIVDYGEDFKVKKVDYGEGC